MFDQIFERSDALRRQFGGPLLDARLAYLRHRAEQGAPRNTLRKLAQYLLVVTERLNLQGERVTTTKQIERAADQWARRRLKHHRFAQLLADFASYLEQEKGLAPRTIITRSWVAKEFLRRALQPKRTLHEITIRQIDEVLAHKGTEGGY